jgi:hypothetical protein
VPDPLKFQRALFPDMEPLTVVGTFDGCVNHRRVVIEARNASDDILRRARGKNCGIAIALPIPNWDDKEIEELSEWQKAMSV